VPAERLRAERPGQVWALDFQHDQTSDGRALRLLNVVVEGDELLVTARHRGEDLAYPVLVDPEFQVKEDWACGWGPDCRATWFHADPQASTGCASGALSRTSTAPTDMGPTRGARGSVTGSV